MAFDAAINLRFDRSAGQFILGDPRMTISRASTGTAINRLGRIYTAPANTLRPRFNPATGVCEGFYSERQTTNLLLRSEEFDNASWTKTSLTVTANSTTAPDGNVTADTLAATGTSGNAAQAITITAGRGITASVFAKANASSFLWVQVTDGTNTVECWFNLSSGATGTNTAGTSTCVFNAKLIEALPNGWYRCSLDVTTATSTAFTVKFGPAAADNTQPANTNSIYAWGAQAEAERSVSAMTSYIATAGSTVQRQAEMVQMPIDTAWFNASEGTMVFEFVNRAAPNGVPGSHVWGGVANTFNDNIYLSRNSLTVMRAVFLVGGVSIATLDKTWDFTPGVVGKLAVAWAANDLSMVVNGGTPATSAAAFTAPTFARFGLGCAPWSTSDNGNKPSATVRAFRYIPRRISNAEMQTLTAA